MNKMSKLIYRSEEKKKLELMLAKLDTKSQLVQEPSLSLSAQSKVQKTAVNAEGGGSSIKLPLDPSKMKRLANNRLSSHRCRIKREIKRLELEEKCSELMVKVVNKTLDDSIRINRSQNLLQMQKLPIMIDYYARRQIQLKGENEKLKQNISNAYLKLYCSEARADNLRKEIQNLRMIYEAKVVEVQLEQKLQTQNLQYDSLADANNIDHFFA